MTTETERVDYRGGEYTMEDYGPGEMGSREVVVSFWNKSGQLVWTSFTTWYTDEGTRVIDVIRNARANRN